MPANLQEWVAAAAQKALAVVTISNTQLHQFISVDVDIGLDQSNSATIRLPADQYPTWAPPAKVEIDLGYFGVNGGTRRVFEGELESVDTRFIPYFIELKAASYLKRAQRNAGNTDPISVDTSGETINAVLTWAGMTDSQIWNSLMQLANIPTYVSGDGDGRTITGPVYLLPNDNILHMITSLDAASNTGQHTFEFAGTVYRRPVLRVPLNNPKYLYNEGSATYPEMRVYALDRQSSDKDVLNQMIITGRPVDGAATDIAPGAVVQAESPYWGRDGQGNVVYAPYSLQGSPFIETRDVAITVADRYMIEKNKISDAVEMRTPLNPFPLPGETVGILSERLTGLTTRVNYFVMKIHHHWGTDGATTDWNLEGGAGANGYLVGLPPQAVFTVKATRETWLVGGVLTTFITVTADGSTSHDPDGAIASYSWSNNKNGTTGSAAIYITQFTVAQWEDATTPPTITLTVTDSDSPDPHTNSTGPLDVHSMLENGDVATIAMYFAAYGKAYATPDGWQTIHDWTPPGGTHVISVCRIGADGTNYLGLDDGHIYKTTDYLETAPTVLTWSAPGGSAVNALWMSELDSNTIAIGLANGDFWITHDGFATAPTLQRNFGNPIQWINGSAAGGTGGTAAGRTQWRACVGQDVWYTDNDFTGARVLVSFAGLTTKQNELTNFANYASAAGSVGSALLKREADGVNFTPAGVSPLPSEVHMTAFINTDTLLIGDDQGRTYISEPASAMTTPVQATSIGHGAIHDLLRDNVNLAAAYGASDTALSKTPDRAVTWHDIIILDGTTTKGMQLGYDSASLTPIVPPPALSNDVIQRASYVPAAGDTMDLFAGGGNGTIKTMSLFTLNVGSSINGTNDDPPANWYLRSYTPADYTGAHGTHTWVNAGQATGLGNPPTEYWSRTLPVWSTNQAFGVVPPSNGQWSLFLHRFVLPADRTFACAELGLKFKGPTGTTEQIIKAAYLNDAPVTYQTGVYEQSIILTDVSSLVADGVTENLLAFWIEGSSNPANFAGNGFAWNASFGTVPYDEGGTAMLGETDGTILIVSGPHTRTIAVSTLGSSSAFPPAPPAGWNGPPLPDELPDATNLLLPVQQISDLGPDGPLGQGTLIPGLGINLQHASMLGSNFPDVAQICSRGLFKLPNGTRSVFKLHLGYERGTSINGAWVNGVFCGSAPQSGTLSAFAMTSVTLDLSARLGDLRPGALNSLCVSQMGRKMSYVWEIK